MSDVMLALVIADCRRPVADCDGDVKARLRAAMEKAKDHFMVLDRDTQFRGAVGAVLEHYGKDSPEYERIVKELDMLRKFNAFLNAAQQGLSVSPPELEDGYEAIGMLGMWTDIAK